MADFETASEEIKKLIGPPTPEETKLLQNEIALSNARLAAINQNAATQTGLLKAIGFDPVTGKYDASKASIKAGQIDPEQAALVDTIYGQEMDNALEQVREVMAPARGLRPTDTPITDRAFRVAGTIGSEAARAKLDLGQRAFTNRLALIEGAGQMGLGLATATGSSPGTVATNLMGNRYSVAPTSISGSGFNFDLGEAFDSIPWDDIFSTGGT